MKIRFYISLLFFTCSRLLALLLVRFSPVTQFVYIVFLALILWALLTSNTIANFIRLCFSLLLIASFSHRFFLVDQISAFVLPFLYTHCELSFKAYSAICLFIAFHLSNFCELLTVDHQLLLFPAKLPLIIYNITNCYKLNTLAVSWKRLES